MAKNFLLGRGENLVDPLTYRSGGGAKSFPYSFADNLATLSPKMEAIARSLDRVAKTKAPNGEAVISITLHPAFMARTYFPNALLATAGFKLIGSRPREVTPRKADKEIRLKPNEPPRAEETPELIVSGQIKSIQSLEILVKSLTGKGAAAEDFAKIEDIRVQPVSERVHVTKDTPTKTKIAWEIVLHASAGAGDYIVKGFLDFVRATDGPKLDVDESRRIYAGGICFLPARGILSQVEAAAEFPFLRCVRPMPQMDREILRLGGLDKILCALPTGPALSPNMRGLILDGGMPKNVESLKPWVTVIDAPGIGKRHPLYEEHGLSVVSAALFGPIRDGIELAPPVYNIDMVRVVDAHTGTDKDDYEYLDSLARIRDYLLAHGHKYDFVCLCCGPCVPIDDGDPSAWTATLDPICHDLKGLLFSAVGNGGLWERAKGMARIQPPSDGVNLMAIGAYCNSGKKWERAPYSCVGPGRRPGVVRPDVVCFGGRLPDDGFYTVGMSEGTAVPGMGTSLAAPNAMRTAAGVKASLGEQINPLALKALLINRSSRVKHHILDVGWGRMMESPAELISTADNEVVVIFQGKLPPSNWRTAAIPIPKESITGKVEITATFCLATRTDPHHPVNYTRSALEVTFRPHSQKFSDPEQQRADSDTFFKPRTMYQKESQLRREAFKWETVLHRARKFDGAALHDPCFDLYYTQREDGHDAETAEAVAYALVIRVKADEVGDLYNRVFRRYRNKLVPLRPVLILPINFTT